MPGPTYPKFSATFYFYAVIGDKKFPAQATVNGDDDDFGTGFAKVIMDLNVKGEDNEGITYEPRSVSGNFSGGGSNKPTAVAAAASTNGNPDCPIHKEPITTKQGKFGPFTSCSIRDEQGNYCNWKPGKV